MTACQKCEIKDLDPDKTSVYVECLLIAKSVPREFGLQQDGTKRGVMNFTVRDSKRNFINCGIWGSDIFVNTYDLAFHIGDVITINIPRIANKKQSNENFKPLTPSRFELIVNERKSFICRDSGQKNTELEALINEPIKPTSGALNLEDVVCGGSNVKKNLVDLVVMVRMVKPIRNLTTKFGDKVLREVVVIDESNGGVTLNIWGGDYTTRADEWKPLETILHLIDVQSDYSVFSKSVALTIAKRTIIIENPLNSSRSCALQEFVRNTSLPQLDNSTIGGGETSIDLAEITNVMSVHKIHDQCEVTDGDEQFTALIYAVITKLNLDPSRAFGPLSKHCKICNKYLKILSDICENLNCVVQLSEMDGPYFVEKFNINMDLSDHTGTLEGCRLMDNYAMKVLGVGVDEFLTYNENEIEALRWKFLLGRYAIKVLVKRKTAFRPRAIISILDCAEVDGDAAVSSLKVY